MITFFSDSCVFYAVETREPLPTDDISKLIWLFRGAKPIHEQVIPGEFTGPRHEMVTPWSTNAVEITQNM